jgi:anti-sigma factor RsiW
MEPTTHGAECEAFRDDLASLAIGALTGLDRARVLAHLETCPQCTAEVEELSATADVLTSVIPGAEPPPGFADRTMELIRADQVVPLRPATRPVLRRVAAVAAMVVLLAVGTVVGAEVASSGRHAPSTAVSTTPLHSTVGARGTVMLVSTAHQGWLVMTLHHTPSSGSVTCSVTLADGSHKNLGEFDVSDGYGAWSVDLPVPASTVRTVSVVDDAGAKVAWARVN